MPEVFRTRLQYYPRLVIKGLNCGEAIGRYAPQNHKDLPSFLPRLKPQELILLSPRKYSERFPATYEGSP